MEYLEDQLSFFEAIYEKIKQDSDQVDLVKVLFENVSSKILELEKKIFPLLPTFKWARCFFNELHVKQNLDYLDENFSKDTLKNCWESDADDENAIETNDKS